MLECMGWADVLTAVPILLAHTHVRRKSFEKLSFFRCWREGDGRNEIDLHRAASVECALSLHLGRRKFSQTRATTQWMLHVEIRRSVSLRGRLHSSSTSLYPCRSQLELRH